MGSIVVVVAVTGQDTDPDGFAVSVDGGTPRTVDGGAAVRFSDLSPGTHPVSVDGVASNCTLRDANPRTMTVVPREATAVVFGMYCLALSIGKIRVLLSTPGFDRFGAALDDGPVVNATDGTVLFTDLMRGVHPVRLHVDAGVCLIDEPNPRPTPVTGGQVKYVFFALTCPTASLLVAVTTTGAKQPNGFTAYVVHADDAFCYLYTCQNQFVNANGTVRFDQLSVVGACYVALRGVPGNWYIYVGPIPRYEPVTPIADFIDESNIEYARANSSDPADRKASIASFNHSIATSLEGARRRWREATRR